MNIMNQPNISSQNPLQADPAAIKCGTSTNGRKHEFDSKENTVTRAVTFNDTMIGDDTLVGLFRVRFTDGAVFTWRTPAMADLKPLELANVLEEVAAQITKRYGGKP